MVLSTFEGNGWDYPFPLYLEALGLLPVGLEALDLKTLGLKALDGLLPRYTIRAITLALCTTASAVRAFITAIAVDNRVRADPVFNDTQYVAIVVQS